jgi:ATP-dependent DNA helicase DinG
MHTFAEAMEVVKTALPGWEPRQQQADMAAVVEDWFAERWFGPDSPAESEEEIDYLDPGNQPRHLFAQAPTGVGKSLAYLIPAILSGRRTVVSVTTKALQDQLMAHDLPFLAQHLPPFTWAVLKGRSSYFCLNRASATEEHEVPQDLIAAVKEYARDTSASMLREDLPVQFTDQQWWKVSSESEFCSDCKDDPTLGCGAQRARVKAQDARIVVVNHALFFTDLQVSTKTAGNATLIGSYDRVVFDEGHEVFEVASQTLSHEVSDAGIDYLVSSATNWVSNYARETKGSTAAMDAATIVQQASSDLFATLRDGVKPTQGTSTKRLREDDVFGAAERFLALIDAVRNLAASLSACTVSEERATKRRKTITAQCTNIVTTLTSALADEFDETVRWVEVGQTAKGRTKVTMKTSPIDVAPTLAKMLFSRVPCAVVSATLAVNGSFDFAASRLGIANYRSVIVTSPFNFAEQGRIYVPGDLPKPSGKTQQEWEAAVQAQIIELIRSAQGRTLVLFTSVAHMRRTATALRRVLPYKILVQGEASVRELGREFLADNETVLLGTKSFFTGFDARGEACSQVILTKLPFPVPSEPLTEARCEVIDRRGGSSFAEYSVPVTSLVLQQAVGRLIRHSNDRGVVAILDPRMVSTGYGRKMLGDLPPMPRVADLDGATEFLVEVREHFSSQGVGV